MDIPFEPLWNYFFNHIYLCIFFFYVSVCKERGNTDRYYLLLRSVICYGAKDMAFLIWLGIYDLFSGELVWE